MRNPTRFHKWTDDDVAKLIELGTAGASDRAIALRLIRSIDAVKSKWNVLRSSTHPELPNRYPTTSAWVTRRNLARAKA